MSRVTKLFVRSGDILHVPYPNACLNYLAVSPSIVVSVEHHNYPDVDPLDRFEQRWAGIHHAHACRHHDEDKYGEPRLIWIPTHDT